MSTENPIHHNQHSNDEIDLRKLLKAIGEFFNRIWFGFIRIIIGIRRETNRWLTLLISLALIGAIGGFLKSKLSTTYYKSSMLLHSSIFRGQLFDSSVEKLNLLCSEAGRPELAKTLGISKSIADSIRGFEAIPFVSEEEIIQVEILREQLRNLKIDQAQINSIIGRIQIENKSTYEIVVYVYSTELVSELQDPIVSYFKKNPYVEKRLHINEANRKAKSRKIENELKVLDSLQLVIYQNLSSLSDRSREGSNNVILADENTANPLSVIREKIALYDQFLNNQRLLTLEPEFEVVDGFTTFSKPEGSTQRQETVYGLLAGLAIGYAFLIIKNINAYLSRVEKQNLESQERQE